MTRSAPRPWSGPHSGHPVVVGVEPGQPPHVVAAAARLAAGLRTGLVCAWVDPTHVVVDREPGGALDLMPVDPDADETARDAPDDELVALLAGLLEPLGVPWRYVYVTGEVARGLAHVADEHDASLIVVGVRRPGEIGWRAVTILGPRLSSIAAWMIATEPMYWPRVGASLARRSAPPSWAWSSRTSRAVMSARWSESNTVASSSRIVMAVLVAFR